jgi:hypothetical protein
MATVSLKIRNVNLYETPKASRFNVSLGYTHSEQSCVGSYTLQTKELAARYQRLAFIGPTDKDPF